MNLNEDEIYDNIESFRNKNGFSQDKMAKIMGLSNKQAYSNMIKNRTLKMSYFINLINKTDIDTEKILYGSTKQQQCKIPEFRNITSETKVQTYSCPDCIDKQKEIDQLKEKLEDVRDKYITALEELQGKNANRQCG